MQLVVAARYIAGTKRIEVSTRRDIRNHCIYSILGHTLM